MRCPRIRLGARCAARAVNGHAAAPPKEHDECRQVHSRSHSINSSARASSVAGTTIQAHQTAHRLPASTYRLSPQEPSMERAIDELARQLGCAGYPQFPKTLRT
jgi:hypothetical protein